MGTLFDQPVRQSHVYDDNKEIQNIIDISIQYNITIQETVDILKFLEMKRTNDLYKANGDIHDEQLAGFGELFESFIKKFEPLVTTTKGEEMQREWVHKGSDYDHEDTSLELSDEVDY